MDTFSWADTGPTVNGATATLECKLPESMYLNACRLFSDKRGKLRIYAVIAGENLLLGARGTTFTNNLLWQGSMYFEAGTRIIFEVTPSVTGTMTAVLHASKFEGCGQVIEESARYPYGSNQVKTNTATAVGAGGFNVTLVPPYAGMTWVVRALSVTQVTGGVADVTVTFYDGSNNVLIENLGALANNAEGVVDLSKMAGPITLDTVEGYLVVAVVAAGVGNTIKVDAMVDEIWL